MRTDSGEANGTALCFTIGRGNEVVVAVIEALRPHVIGRRAHEIAAHLGAFSADLINDSQLRWLGPEKGVMQMAIGTVVNAALDLAAKMAGRCEDIATPAARPGRDRSRARHRVYLNRYVLRRGAA